MNKIKIMNLEQLKEVSGGTDHGRLTKQEIAAVEFCIRLCKYKAWTLESYLDTLRNCKRDTEYIDAVEKYARTFWDCISSF